METDTSPQITALARTDLPVDQIDSYEMVLELVRSGRAVTRPDLSRQSGLGRSIVAERVTQIMARGLITEHDSDPIARGRAPRHLQFTADRAYLLVGSFGALGVGAAVTDLSGAILASTHGPWSVESGPEASLERIAELFSDLLVTMPASEIWGVTIGLPGPVEFSTGHPIMPPIMPGWNAFDVRGWLSERFHAPVWVDNDANLMALGQLTQSAASPSADMLFIKAGSGIGAGIVSGGRLHRGANGGAGDIGHLSVPGFEDVLCRCGRRGCLEAVAGGWAVARDGLTLAESGASPVLARRLQEEGLIRPLDVVNAALAGDPESVDLLVRSATVLGERIADVASFFNPSIVAVGGALTMVGDLYIATIRKIVYSRAMLLATRDLQVMSSSDDANLALYGGATLAIDELFGRGRLRRWFVHGTPLTDIESVYQQPDALVA